MTSSNASDETGSDEHWYATLVVLGLRTASSQDKERAGQIWEALSPDARAGLEARARRLSGRMDSLFDQLESRRAAGGASRTQPVPPTAPAAVRSATATPTLWQRLRDLLTVPALPGMLAAGLAVSVAANVVLAVLSLSREEVRQGHFLQTLHPVCMTLKDTVIESDLRRLVRGLDAQIVSGPTQNGEYCLGIEPDRTEFVLRELGRSDLVKEGSVHERPQ